MPYLYRPTDFPEYRLYAKPHWHESVFARSDPSPLAMHLQDNNSAEQATGDHPNRAIALFGPWLAPSSDQLA
jgi:hypothetical protein